MNRQEIFALLLNRIDLKGLLINDLLDVVLKGALDKMVQDSSNPYDDLAVAALYPPLKKALEEQLVKLLADLVKPD
jgi:hypothetical protein